jgi:hypothetical protein
VQTTAVERMPAGLMEKLTSLAAEPWTGDASY